MKIAILLGSIRKGRQSHRIALYLTQRLLQGGNDTSLIDLVETPLPLMEERVGRHPHLPPEVGLTGKRLQEADALLFVSPEYHGSYSGVLKNAVDYFWLEFSKKPIGVVGVSAGKFGGLNATSQLQQLVLSLGAFPMPTRLLVPEVDQVYDAQQQRYRQSFVEASDRFLEEFIWFAAALSANRKESLAR